MAKLIRYGAAAALVLFVAWLIFSGRYRIELTNGYRLSRLNRHRVTVTETLRGDYPVISGNVEKYAVGMPFIVGYASTNNMPADTNILAGYFIVNTDSRHVLQGLSEDHWKTELARIHWRSVQLEKVP